MPAMTLTEKIIARAAGRDAVRPGDEVWATVDLAAMHDSSGPRRIALTLERFGGHLWDPARIVLTIDHFAPAANQRHAEIVSTTRSWAKTSGIPFAHQDGRIVRRVSHARSAQ